MTKSMKAVRDRKTDNRRISQNMEKAFKKMAQVFGYPNREYKDRVFRMLLKEPKVALEVYNAMNGTLYDNPDELIITTLENAVYLGMKNDVSFILGTQLVLYEHQSTPNPNMPLRNLAYVACVYMAYVFGDNLYGRKLIKIPEPRFVVFYNGTDKMPEQSVLRLFDANGILSSVYEDEKRTELYYCHPYRSCERGSNENANKLIRRWIPKGANISTYTDDYIKHVQEWINNYPRKLFNGLSSNQYRSLLMF